MYDVVVVMYHDQGHIPLKVTGFVYDEELKRWNSVQGVNITLGLPIIRVSVDHGHRLRKGRKRHSLGRQPRERHRLRRENGRRQKESAGGESMNKIVISHPLYHVGMEMLEGKAELIVPNNGDSDQIIDVLRDADAFILRIGKIDRKAIEQCPNLKVITRPGVGYDNVDVEAATERGIPVVLCPAANARAVAEHTLTLLLACSKNLVESCVETKGGNFNIRNKYAAVDVENRLLVLLGFGHIGRLVAQMSAGIGMKIGIYDPFVKREDVEGARIYLF